MRHWWAIRQTGTSDDFKPVITRDIVTGIAFPGGDPDAVDRAAGPLGDWAAREIQVHKRLRRLMGGDYERVFCSGLEAARAAAIKVGLDDVRVIVRQVVREAGQGILRAPRLGFDPDRLKGELAVDADTVEALYAVWCYWAVQGALYGLEAVPLCMTATPKAAAATTEPEKTARQRTVQKRQPEPARRARAALRTAIPQRIAVAAG